MSIHKFKIGQIVEFSPAFARNIPGGVYKSRSENFLNPMNRM